MKGKSTMQKFKSVLKRIPCLIFTLIIFMFANSLVFAQMPGDMPSPQALTPPPSALPQPAPQALTPPPSVPQPAISLYDRVGGVYSIAAVVDDFTDKLLSDPIITANQKVVAAMGKITKAGLKYRITELVCQVSGGPQKYTGKPMKDAHQNLNISEGEWAATVKILLGTLTKFNVPEKEQNELLVLIGSTKNDIVQASVPSIPQGALPQLPSPLPEAQQGVPGAPLPLPTLEKLPTLQAPPQGIPKPLDTIQFAPGLPPQQAVEPQVQLQPDAMPQNEIPQIPSPEQVFPSLGNPPPVEIPSFNPPPPQVPSLQFGDTTGTVPQPQIPPPSNPPQIEIPQPAPNLLPQPDALP